MCPCEIDWNAAGTWITALATIALAIVAGVQIGHLRRQLIVESEREKRWRTIDACEQWSLSDVLDRAKVRIFAARMKGELGKQPLLHARDIRTVLNYLDALAIGVRQGAYLEDVVLKHLSTVIVDIVANAIDGGWADFQIRAEHYPDLIWLRDRALVANPGLSKSSLPLTPAPISEANLTTERSDDA